MSLIKKKCTGPFIRQLAPLTHLLSLHCSSFLFFLFFIFSFFFLSPILLGSRHDSGLSPLCPYVRTYHPTPPQLAQATFRMDGRVDKWAGNGPFARPLARLLAPLTHLLAPYCPLRSRAPLRLFVRSLPSSWERDFYL